MRWLIIGSAFAAALGVAQMGLAEDAKTTRTWKAKCASCHGEDGKGATDQGKKMAVEDMTAKAWQKKFTDAQLKEAIEKGVKRDKGGVKQEMDAFGAKLKPDQVDALVQYVRGLAK